MWRRDWGGEWRGDSEEERVKRIECGGESGVERR